MLTKEQGYDLIFKTIKDELRHKWYDRTVYLADKYYKLYTGDRIEEELARFGIHESKAMFDQRVEITRSVTPCILYSTKLFFEKVCRSKPLNRDIYWQGVESEDRKKEVEATLQQHQGQYSLDQYLEFTLTNYNYVDPNAFNIIDFKPFDSKKEKPKPYSFVATSEQAINYEYDNGILQWLIILVKDEQTQKDKYCGYFGLDALTFTEISRDDNSLSEAEVQEWTDPETQESYMIVKINSRFYKVEYFEPKAQRINADRLGFIQDPETAGETFVSLFHSAMPLLEKTLKINSELDLSTSLCTFPERFAYVRPCDAEGCHNGQTPDGKTCKACGGTGEKHFSTSTQEVTTIKLPRTPDKDSLIDLNLLTATKSPPIDLLTWMDQYIDKLKVSVHKTMFNADLFSKTEVTATATEKTLERDNLDDTLYPFARKLSQEWTYIVTQVADFMDYGTDITVIHKMPERYNMRSLTELFADLQSAKTAGASASTTAAIEDDINEILYSNRPDELKRIRVKNMLNPFRGFSDVQANIIISSGRTTKFNAVLWDNFETIMNELESENETLYDDNMSMAKIKSLLAAKVEKYIGQIEGEKPPPAQTFGNF